MIGDAYCHLADLPDAVAAVAQAVAAGVSPILAVSTSPRGRGAPRTCTRAARARSWWRQRAPSPGAPALRLCCTGSPIRASWPGGAARLASTSLWVLAEVARWISRDFLLVETDSPVEFAGQSARPSWALRVSRSLARERGEREEALREALASNLSRYLLRFGDAGPPV